MSQLFENPTTFGNENGLPEGMITGMVEDNDGYLWITMFGAGLYRFDGSYAKRFNHDPEDSLSLSTHRVNALYFDREKEELWVGTELGMERMALKTGKFRSYRFMNSRPATEPYDIVIWVMGDSEGIVWVSVRGRGIFRYDEDKDEFRQFYFESEEPGALFDTNEKCNYIGDYSEDQENDSLLWLGTSSGLLKFNKQTETFRRYVYSDAPIFNTFANRFLEVYKHVDGKIYLSMQEGFGTFDPVTEFFSFLPSKDHQDSNLSLFKTVRNIIAKSKDELWITSDYGVAIFNTQSQSVTYSKVNPDSGENIYGARFLDKDGRIWTWPESGRIVQFDPLNNQAINFDFEVKEPKKQIIVRKILEDTLTGDLFVTGQYCDGLYKVDRENGTWNLEGRYPDFFTEDMIFQGRDMARMRNGDWLIGSALSLLTFSLDGKSLTPHPLQPSFENPAYRAVFEDSRGNIWAGSYYYGLVQIDPVSGSSRVFYDELQHPTIPRNNEGFISILEDQKRQIWVRGRQGLSVYNYEKDEITNYPFLNEEGKLGNILHFLEDQEGYFWLNTEKQGLLMIDPRHPEKGIIHRLTQEDGMSSLRYRAMTVGKDGFIYLAQSGGIEKLDPVNLSSEYFKVNMGDVEDLHTMSALSTGEIAIGYRNGVSIFHPDSLRKNREIPKPYLTSFQVFGKEAKQEKLLPYTSEIRLKPNENFFSLEFSAIGFSFSKHIQYEYMLEGFDPEWVDPGDRRYVSYTNVGSGDYIFRVKAANNEGVWTETPLEFAIHVATPWYRTWWAYLVYGISAMALVYGVFRLRLNRQLEHAETRRLKELDEVKTRLYTNITHEFRTPLTVITGMAEETIENDGQLPPRKNLKNAQMIKRNSDRLLTLVNQMLDLRKLESGSMTLHMIHDDIIVYLKYIIEAFHSLAASKNIRLHFSSEVQGQCMDYDPDRILNIVSNLLSNAIKFTDNGGKVAVTASTDRDAAGGDWLQLSVKDNGIGISSEKLPHIFNRFYQVDDESNRQAEGTGIGLTLTKELIQLMGGRISVKSQVDEGTEFKVLLPVSNHARPVISGLDIPEPISKVTLSSPSVTDKQKMKAKFTSKNDRSLVLVIEDNKDVVQYLSACLEKNYRIAIANNGKKGIEKAFEIIPDIILSDVMMPEKDGFDVCKTLKSDMRTSHIPIILLTAKADMDSKIEGLEQGADAYLPKPFNKKELLIRLKNLLELRLKLRAYYRSLASGENPSNGNSSTEQYEHQFVRRAQAIIENHMDDYRFSVKTLCRELAMSHSQVHRKLTALTGYSANRFIRFVRLAKAKALLTDSDKIIAEVAYETGFNDPVYFSRIFRKEFGLTPSAFRQNVN